MKLLILGSGGLLGSELVSQAKRAGLNYIGVSKNGRDGAIKCDISIPGAISSLVKQYKPSLVVNCSAITNLILCESDLELANSLHVEMVHELASCDSRVIHISTDSIFSGETGGYTESAIAKPLNNYAKSKLDGESALNIERDLVIRTNIFGRARSCVGNSFYDWILNQSTCGEICGYVNIFFNPVSVNTLSALILGKALKDATGIINVGTHQGVSKHEFIKKVLKANNREAILYPASYVDLDVMRPRNTILNVEKLASVTGYVFDIDDEIEKVIHAVPGW